MDIASIIGIVGGAACIVMSVLTSGGTLGGIIDIPSVFMTIGGSYAATMIALPLAFSLLPSFSFLPSLSKKSLASV